MARNRQRAKQRQEERRAARKAGGGQGGQVPNSRTEAPPEELGRSDYTLDHTVEEEEFIGDLQVGDDRLPDDDDGLLLDDDSTGTEVAGPRGVRGGREHEDHEHHERGRVMGFLHAVWLELGRVQWPDRNQLTSLTGITLMFVLIVGGYLGLLDAIFSKLVSAIL